MELHFCIGTPKGMVCMKAPTVCLNVHKKKKKKNSCKRLSVLQKFLLMTGAKKNFSELYSCLLQVL